MKTFFYSFLTLLLVAFGHVTTASAQQVNSKIQEVYGNKTQELVINDPDRSAFLTDLIENRIKIIELALSPNEKYAKLSDVALLNKYNTSLTRDIAFDANTFNALKYDFIVSSKTPVVYRVDNTDYLIVIQPQTLKKD
ncbi:MAG: GTP cyclohydrolase [Bacteroidota bacterium]